MNDMEKAEIILRFFGRMIEIWWPLMWPIAAFFAACYGLWWIGVTVHAEVENRRRLRRLGRRNK